jgi:23S rRNA (uracil1939-C5)-methyltransferase
MVLGEAEQRAWKERLLRDALARVGGFERPALQPLRAVAPDLGYRNRVELAVEPGARGWSLGLRRPGEGRGIVEVGRCLLQHESANAVMATVREHLDALPVPTAGDDGDLRVVLRRSWATGELLVVLREAGGRFPAAAELADLLDERHPELRGVVRVRAGAGRRGGSSSTVLVGRGWIGEQIGEQEFRLPAATFVQVNSAGAALLTRLVLEGAGALDGGTVLDLYGGVGAYAFALLRAGAGRVDVCDADAGAVECGRQSARDRGERGLEFHRDDVLSFLRSRPAGERPAMIVANPPRTGLGKGVAVEMLRVASPRLVLVSCDPATLARDLRLLGEGGYRTLQVTPVDLFPQTAHVEAVAVLEKQAR